MGQTIAAAGVPIPQDCVGRFRPAAPPENGEFFRAEETVPTRCCLPQVDPLHAGRSHSTRQESMFYDCKVMVRVVKKRIDGMKEDSPAPLKSSWPIDLPPVNLPCEAVHPFYDIPYEEQILSCCADMLGKEAAEQYLDPENKERWKSIAEMEEFFQPTEGGPGFPRVDLLDRWCSDIEFGRLRYNATHPNCLRQVKRKDDLPKILKIKDDDVVARISESTLEDAMKLGKIFLIDYSAQRNLRDQLRFGKKSYKEDRDHLNGQKPRKHAVLCNPIAMFYKEMDEPLMPVAIQLYGDCAGKDATKIPVNPIYTPDDNFWAWTCAKLYFNQADLLIQLVGSAFVHTAYVGAALSAMTNKMLAVHHPIRQLIRPHIRGCQVHGKKWFQFFSKGDKGLLLQWLPCDMDGHITKGDGTLGSEDTHLGGLKELMKFQYLRYDFNNSSFKHDWRERMDKVEDLDEFYYRDDGQLLWDATEEYVMNVIRKYYIKADDIEDDHELKEWIREMSNRITRVMELHPARPWEPIVFNIVTIIFVNTIMYNVQTSRMYDCYAAACCFPSNPKSAPPIEKSKDEWNLQDMLDIMPDKRSTLLQMATAYVLSGKYDHKMFKPEQGHIPPPPFAEYERDIFVDKSCNQFTQAFKVRVREIIEVIRERNKYRRIRPVGGCVCPVTLDNEPPYLACKFNGTRIVHVEPGSNAERAGLTAGPNIWMIQGKAMTTAEQIKEIVEAVATGKFVADESRKLKKKDRVKTLSEKEDAFKASLVKDDDEEEEKKKKKEKEKKKKKKKDGDKGDDKDDEEEEEKQKPKRLLIVLEDPHSVPEKFEGCCPASLKNSFGVF